MAQKTSNNSSLPMRAHSLVSLLNQPGGVVAGGTVATPPTLGQQQQQGGIGSSFDWPQSGIVSLDSEELWNNMDRIINDLGGKKEWINP
jgi:hypothetical protein